jgi:agmatinase
MNLGVDPFSSLRVVDYGDCRVGPTIEQCHDGLRAAVSDVVRAGAVPVILGGDHSLDLPVLRVMGENYGPDGYSVIHFDTHADTGIYEPGAVTEHAAPFYRAVTEGCLDGNDLFQIGLRGSWPEPREFDWMRTAGITWYTMDDVEDRGLGDVLSEVIERAGQRARTYLSVDIDVLDPAFAPGTGTPEPGGLTTRELLRAVRRIGMSLDLCGMDVVEVSPPYDPSGITALAANRVIYETLTGMALRRSGKNARPERP